MCMHNQLQAAWSATWSATRLPPWSLRQPLPSFASIIKPSAGLAGRKRLFTGQPGSWCTCWSLVCCCYAASPLRLGAVAAAAVVVPPRLQLAQHPVHVAASRPLGGPKPPAQGAWSTALMETQCASWAHDAATDVMRQKRSVEDEDTADVQQPCTLPHADGAAEEQPSEASHVGCSRWRLPDSVWAVGVWPHLDGKGRASFRAACKVWTGFASGSSKTAKMDKDACAVLRHALSCAIGHARSFQHVTACAYA